MRLPRNHNPSLTGVPNMTPEMEARLNYAKMQRQYRIDGWKILGIFALSAVLAIIAGVGLIKLILTGFR